MVFNKLIRKVDCMKKLIIIAIIIVCIFSACSYEKPSASVEDIERSYSMSLKSKIDKYSLCMSSVPGFPLEIVCDRNSDIELKLRVTCERGSLLLWHEDGTIEYIGLNYEGEFETTTLYWLPLEGDRTVMKTPVSFSIRAFEVDSEKETNRIDGEILLDKEQYYVKKIK